MDRGRKSRGKGSNLLSRFHTIGAYVEIQKKEMEIESEEIPHEENLLAKREATKARRELQAAKSLSRAAKALLCIQNGRKPPLEKEEGSPLLF